MDIIETMQTECATLTEQLAELDQRVETERPALVAQISKLNKAIKALSKPTKTPGERKPMSDEAKARIKAGLERARAAKQGQTGAAETKPGPTSVPQPAAGTDKKAPVRAN